MSAGQYRKRPVVVEAMRYGTNNGWQIRAWSKSAVIESPVLDPTPDNPTGHYLQILTLEGMMSAGVGDWIIRGVKGEFYPCKPDIFELTYEPADNPAPPPPATDPHEPKKPRRAPTREEFIATLNGFRDLKSDGDVILNNAMVEVDLIKAFDTLAAERDAARAALQAQGEIRLDIRGASELRLRVGTLLQLHWKTLTDEQLLAIKAICDKAAGVKPSQDPRIEAWRALTEEERSYRVEDLRTWADLVEAGATLDGADHGPSPLRIAASALEALGEKA